MKYNIVTGLKRTGTSLMMLLLRQAGVPISGYKYHFKVENGNVQIIDDPAQIDKNPLGCWELGAISVRLGIQPGLKNFGLNGDTIKLIAEAYFQSNKDYHDKTIVMIRNPKKMIYSQIMLDEKPDFEKQDFLIEMQTDILKLLKPVKPYIVVEYEKLLENPEKEMKRVLNFLGRGDIKHIKGYVKNSLNRSKELEFDTSEFDKLYQELKNNQE
jgi:hypothetical protein